MNSKHWPRIGFPKGMSDANIPWDARFFTTKQQTPAPAPPAASDELIKKQKELEAREAEQTRVEKERKKLQAAAGAAELAAGESAKLQSQFRSAGRRRTGRPEGPSTGLRI